MQKAKPDPAPGIGGCNPARDHVACRAIAAGSGENRLIVIRNEGMSGLVTVSDRS